MYGKFLHPIRPSGRLSGTTLRQRVKWTVLASNWDGGHTLSVCVAEQVTALFVAPFCSERKGERSNERGGLWLTICPLGRGMPESLGLPGTKDGNKLLVLLVSCYVGDLPAETYTLLSLNTPKM